jgi:FkbM family methyltransferase
MASVIVRLGRYRWIHRLVAAVRIFPLAEFVLRRFPLKRRLTRSGAVYRVTSLDQLSIELEVFKQDSYAPALGRRPIETFIDLGCNAGWFAIWLSTQEPNNRLRGLLIDAHPRMITEATWHIMRNQLVNCTVIHGAVGLPPGQSTTSFNLHPSSSASSVLPFQPNKQIPAKGAIAEVIVPAVSVSREWQARFGDADVDLLKIDIEGKELDLITNERAFIRERVRRIVLEWHKWVVSLAQLDTVLASIGFERCGTHNEGPFSGLAVYAPRGECS